MAGEEVGEAEVVVVVAVEALSSPCSCCCPEKNKVFNITIVVT